MKRSILLKMAILVLLLGLAWTGRALAGVNGTASTTGTRGTPGGTSGQIQYNNNGAFGGASTLDSSGNASVNSLGIGTAAPGSAGVVSIANQSTNTLIGSHVGIPSGSSNANTYLGYYTGNAATTGAATVSDTADYLCGCR